MGHSLRDLVLLRNSGLSNPPVGIARGRHEIMGSSCSRKRRGIRRNSVLARGEKLVESPVIAVMKRNSASSKIEGCIYRAVAGHAISRVSPRAGNADSAAITALAG